MSIYSIALILAAGTSAATAPGDLATLTDEGGNRPHSHIHAHGEIDENHDAVLFEVTYIGEVMANVDGGLDRGARYLDNLDVVVEADLEALIGWQGAQIHLYGLYNNGNSISQLAGDAQAVSNIETGTSAVRLYEAWIEQEIGEGFSVKAGLYDLNSEFDSLDASGLFVGSSHGIGADIAQTGLNGPSIFPATSQAIRLEKEFSPGVKIRAALLDGVPGDPDRPKRTVVRLNSEEGALAIAELEVPLGGARILAGHWRYTAEFSDFDGGEGRGNAGTYLRGEAPLHEDDDRRIDAFFRLGTAAGRFNMFDRFTSAGLRMTGVFGGGETDEAGLAVATAWTSAGFRRTTGAGHSETAVELTYRRQVLPFLALQPSVQYVVKPSADPSIEDALVLGLRAEVSFGL